VLAQQVVPMKLQAIQAVVPLPSNCTDSTSFFFGISLLYEGLMPKVVSSLFGGVMARDVKVDFYKVIMPQGVDKTFEALLEEVSKFPDDIFRTKVVREYPVRLSVGVRHGELWHCDIVRIRLHETPWIAHISGSVRPIQMDNDEGLGEATAFLYHPGFKVLVIQHNKMGVSASSLALYFQLMGQYSDSIKLEPIVHPSDLDRIKGLKQVRKFEVKLAGLTNLQAFKNDGLGLSKLLDLTEEFQSPSIRLELSMGYDRKGSLSREAIISALKGIFSIEPDSSKVEHIEVSGVNDSDEKEVLDLIGARMREIVHLMDGVKYTEYSTRNYCVKTSWERRFQELKELFSSPHEGTS
jgi:hypothetical protein